LTVRLDPIIVSAAFQQPRAKWIGLPDVIETHVVR
jgi:hypothetical protein